MQADRWLLPEGIEEALPARAARLERCRRRLLDLFSSWGYDLVIPPLIEYLESLLTGTGPDLDLQTFKLIDQLTGRLMGVRADMTPQVARIDAHHLRREGPVRLCYLGTVLHTRPDGLSGSRSPIQVGAELYGHAGTESDCEVLCLMLETLAAAGLEQVHLDLGHAGIFRALTRAAELPEDAESQLFETLQRKAPSEIEALLAELEVQPALAAGLRALCDLNGGAGVLEAARRALRRAPREARAALESLQAVAEAMHERLPAVALHFDLAELRGYRYEQGIVFAAFVPGHGQEVARGGRYDGIGGVFGRQRPAIGFSADLKTLVALGAEGDSFAAVRGILAPWDADPGLQARVRELRAAGERVIFELPGAAAGARDGSCDRRLVRRGGAWTVVALEA